MNLGHVAPTVGLAAVEVGEAVDLGQLTAVEGLAGEAGTRRVGGEGGDAAADIGGGLGDAEMGLPDQSVPPGRLGDVKGVEHGLGAEVAGGEGDGRAVERPGLEGFADGQLVGSGLG
jgi:hypothetical protein